MGFDDSDDEYPSVKQSAELSIPKSKVGLVIGKGGETIKAIQAQFRVRMKVVECGDLDNKKLRIQGDSFSCANAKRHVEELLSSRPDRVDKSARKYVVQQDVVEVKVPQESVGIVIGKGGEKIKQIQSQTGAKVQLKLGEDRNAPVKTFCISGSDDQMQNCVDLINELVSDSEQRQERSALQMSVPSDKVGLIIGTGGETIKQICKESGAQVDLSRENSGEEKIVTIKGSAEAQRLAQQLIQLKINQTASAKSSYSQSSSTTRVGSVELQVVTGQIQLETTDVIVCSTGPQLDLSSQVAKAIDSELISRGWRPGLLRQQLRDECAPNSKFMILPVYLLPFKAIAFLTTTGDQQWSGEFSRLLQACDQLVSTFTSRRVNYRSLALPAIGTGAAGGNLDTMLDQLWSALTQFTPTNLTQIRLVLMDRSQVDQVIQRIRQKTNGRPQSSINRSIRPIRGVGGKLPFNWSTDATCTDYQLINVASDSDEFRKISTHITTANGSVAIIKIERIENPTRYLQYAIQKNLIEGKLRESGEFHKAERQLFHGTSEANVDGICRGGFNRSLCGDNGTVFGDGCYFSSEFSYSQQYCKGGGKIFYCAVLTGRYLDNSRREKLKVLPDTHHSAVNQHPNPTIFVTFHDNSAYPSHLITFGSSNSASNYFSSYQPTPNSYVSQPTIVGRPAQTLFQRRAAEIRAANQAGVTLPSPYVGIPGLVIPSKRKTDSGCAVQ